MSISRNVCTLAFLFISIFQLVSNDLASAGDPTPVAIVRTGQRELQVRTFDGLRVQVSSEATSEPSDPRELLRVGIGQTLDHCLFRLPNQDGVLWLQKDVMEIADQPPASLIQVDGAAGLLTMKCDQACLVFWDGQGTPEFPSCDLLVVLPGDGSATEEFWSEIAKAPARKILYLSDLNADDVPAALGQPRQIAHHTMAVVGTGAVEKPAATEAKPGDLIVLGSEAWEMPADLQDAFNRMGAANRESQKVFQPLSVQQMNFRPGNGTHTPRWNTEHMMGRQLLFFSQIFHEVDPEVPVLDWNPKQNPEDYVADHSDWNGYEEARRMENVQRFTQQFSYLLDGMPLDRRAKGSRWPTLSALLKQMERHYQEHTANTVAKMKLPDWPSGE